MTHYDAIVGSKEDPRRTYLVSARAHVAGRYDEYWHLAQVPFLEQIANSTIGQPYVEALAHCYDGETLALSAMKARLLGVQTVQWRSACPYCGINTPATFDHYLCKARFPEFATLSWNLVPSCGECNTLKGNRWLDNNQRQFVHAYFDPLPELVRWLFCHVSLRDGDPVAEFRLEMSPSVPDGLQAVLAKHYERLDLQARFRQKASQSLAEAIAFGGRFSADHYAAEYATEAAQLGELYGVNYWESSLMDEMSQNEEFLELVAA